MCEDFYELDIDLNNAIRNEEYDIPEQQDTALSQKIEEHERKRRSHWDHCLIDTSAPLKDINGVQKECSICAQGLVVFDKLWIDEKKDVCHYFCFLWDKIRKFREKPTDF